MSAPAPPARSLAPTVISVGDLRIRHTAREVTLGGTAVALTSTEYRLLHALASRPGETITRAELAGIVWSAPDHRLALSLDVHARRLRGKLQRRPGGATIAGGRGNLTRRIAPAGGGTPLVTLTQYDAQRNPVQTVPPEGVANGAGMGCATNLAGSVNAQQQRQRPARHRPGLRRPRQSVTGDPPLRRRPGAGHRLRPRRGWGARARRRSTPPGPPPAPRW